MKRVLYLSFNPRFEEFWSMSSPDMLAYYRENTGNSAFVYSTVNSIRGRASFYTDFDIPAKYLHRHFDAVVFPAANNLSAIEDLSWLGDLIEDTKVPFLILGMGAQYELNEPITLHPGSQAFLDRAAACGVWIGARGDFTANLLSDRGFKNVQTVGCPSNFINPATDLGAAIEARARSMPSDPTLCVNLEYFRLESEKVRLLTARLTSAGGLCVFQSDNDVFRAVREPHSTAWDTLGWLSEYFLGSTSADDFRRFAAQFGATPSFIPAWLELVRSVDFSIGTRLHGNLIAMQAGTPALVLYHDQRTKELCQVMAMPSAAWSSITTNDDVSTAISGYQFNGSLFDSARQTLARRYIDLLSKVDLLATGHIFKIAGIDEPAESSGSI
jgi:hypothetical protein